MQNISSHTVENVEKQLLQKMQKYKMQKMQNISYHTVENVETRFC